MRGALVIQLKRIYDPPVASDGYRVLVDRVWPRGLTKRAAALDEWVKEVAPSTELRTWFDHRVDRWEAFRARYRHELEQHSGELATLRARAAKSCVTLLYGAKDAEHNQAVVLQEVLDRG
jgi:uncharacterized protein YeaO (DUF488 family)